LSAGFINKPQAERLLAKNQASERYRVGMTWFCFGPPYLAGEGGIIDLLRYWGGEALYNSHDSDKELGPLLLSIGSPAVVEAEVPAELLGDDGLGLAINMARRFAANDTSGDPKFEDNITHALAGRYIRDVHLHPSDSFDRLTGRKGWWRSLDD